MSADGKELLVFGEAAPALVKGIRLRFPLFLALGDLAVLESVAAPEKKYCELPQFPGTARDISFAAPSGLTHQKILDTIAAMRLPMLEKVELFDIFADEKVLGAGRHSMSYSLTFCNPERTLTDDEVTLQERGVLAENLKSNSQRGLLKCTKRPESCVFSCFSLLKIG